MQSGPLQIQMLGGLTIQCGDGRVNDGDGRSRKVWLLIAYMIYNRGRPVVPDELCALLWGDGEEERSSNPLNALKTMFHRARAFLNRLDDGAAGHELILRQGKTYAWNTEIPVTLDIEEFDRLCQAAAVTDDEDRKLEHWLEALSLYQGPFLAKLSFESWVVPISAYYHNLYVQTALEALALLERRARWEDIVRLCQAALEHEPYLEELYRTLIYALLQLERYQEAVTAYENMSELLRANFGITPSGDLLKLYREALHSVNGLSVSSGIILEQLREPPDLGGALICSYDFFKVIYHAVARSIERSGDAVHLALISANSVTGKELPKRSLERAMQNLQELLRSRLRRGDVASRCSASQMVCLLPQANYENSCMVCERVTKAFARQYPHSPVHLHFSIHPMEPDRTL